MSTVMSLSFARQGLTVFDPVELCPTSSGAANDPKSSSGSNSKLKNLLFEVAELNVSFNALVLTSGFNLLSQLVRLDISHNRIIGLKGLPLRLRFLDASHNAISSLDGLQSLLHLDTLLLSHNSLSTLDHCAPNVRILDCSFNSLVSLSALRENNAASMVVLRAEHNMLQRPEDIQVLETMPSLRVVSLNSNAVCGRTEYVGAVAKILGRVDDVEMLGQQQQLGNGSSSSSTNRQLRQQQYAEAMSPSAAAAAAVRHPEQKLSSPSFAVSPGTPQLQQQRQQVDFFSPASSFLQDTVIASKNHARQLFENVEWQIAVERGRLDSRQQEASFSSSSANASFVHQQQQQQQHSQMINSDGAPPQQHLTPEQQHVYQRSVVTFQDDDDHQQQQQQQQKREENANNSGNSAGGGNESFPGYAVLPRYFPGGSPPPPPPPQQQQQQQQQEKEDSPDPRPASSNGKTSPRGKKAGFSVNSTRHTPGAAAAAAKSSPRAAAGKFGFLGSANKRKMAEAARLQAEQQQQKAAAEEEAARTRQKEEEAARQAEEEQKMKEREEQRRLEALSSRSNNSTSLLLDASRHFDHLSGALDASRPVDLCVAGPQHFVSVVVPKQQQLQTHHASSGGVNISVRGNVISSSSGSNNPYSSNFKQQQHKRPNTVHRATEAKIRTLPQVDRDRTPIELPMPMPLLMPEGSDYEIDPVEALSRTALRSETAVEEDAAAKAAREEAELAERELRDDLEKEKARREELEAEVEKMKQQKEEEEEEKKKKKSAVQKRRPGYLGSSVAAAAAASSRRGRAATKPATLLRGSAADKKSAEEVEKHREKTLAQIKASAFRRGSTASASAAGNSSDATAKEAIARAGKVLATASAKGTVQRQAIVQRKLTAVNKKETVSSSVAVAASASADKKENIPVSDAAGAASTTANKDFSPNTVELARARLRLQDTVKGALDRMTAASRSVAASQARADRAAATYQDPFFLDTSRQEGRRVLHNQQSYGWAEEQRAKEIKAGYERSNMALEPASGDIAKIQQRAQLREKELLAREEEIKAIKEKMAEEEAARKKKEAAAAAASKRRGSSSRFGGRSSSYSSPATAVGRFSGHGGATGAALKKKKNSADAALEAELAKTPVAAKRLASGLSEILNDPLSPLSPVTY